MCKGASGGSIDIDPEPFQACRMALLLCKAPLFWKPLNRRHFWVSSIPTNIQLSRGKKHTYQDCTLYFYSRICFFRFSARQYRELILSKPLSCRYIWCKDRIIYLFSQVFSFCKPCKRRNKNPSSFDDLPEGFPFLAHTRGCSQRRQHGRCNRYDDLSY